jgi:hypothetical protein
VSEQGKPIYGPGFWNDNFGGMSCSASDRFIADLRKFADELEAIPAAERTGRVRIKPPKTPSANPKAPNQSMRYEVARERKPADDY